MAKKRRLITRRRVKWAGTVACAGLILALGASYAVESTFKWSKLRAKLTVEIEHGYLVVRLEDSSVDFFNPRGPEFMFHLEDWLRPPQEWDPLSFVGQPELPPRRWPYWRSGRVTFDAGIWVGESVLTVPLLIPIALMLLPTAWLWYSDRRAKPWQCAKCRYDLRGIDTNQCPECGKTRSHTQPS